MDYGSAVLFSVVLVALVSVCLGSLGIYAVIRNRLPGRPLRRVVRNPRLWGLGVLFLVASLLTYSWFLLALGAFCTVCGHALKPTGRRRP